MVKYAEKNLQIPPANGKQWPADLNKRMQYNFDHTAVWVRIHRKKYKNIFSFSIRTSKKLKKSARPLFGRIDLLLQVN
jgi:hypothetical protein